MIELWKDIPDYEGLYQVSNTGKIKSFQKWKRAKCPDEYVIKGTVANNGYAQVTLYKKNHRRKFLVHRLVAEAFVENPCNCAFVNHIDENKLNNCADNLEWCTVRYNNAYGTAKFRSMLTKSLPIVQLHPTGEWIAIYRGVSFAEDITGISHNEIAACLRGRLDSAGGYLWKRKD